MSLPAGTKLGHYEIVSAIGAGGMGEVYKARDTRLDRTVAIKVLPSHVASDPAVRQRFEREARAISSLDHPHICALYDVGRHENTDFLVMQYLDGETLAAWLARGPLPLHRVLKHAIEIANALDRAHRQGIVHRDLKPGNVMLTKDGAKLVDFGLAKPPRVLPPAATMTASAPITVAGTVLGTPQYMAPEQLEGREADARSDLFALGAILYEMVTGRAAFPGSGPASVIAAIISSEPALKELQGLTPPGFDYLVKTCLVKNPEERRQTAHDVRLELERIASSSDLGQAQGSKVKRQWYWRWAATAALLLAVPVGAAWYITRASAPAQRPTWVAILPPGEVSADMFPAISLDGSRVAFTARGPTRDIVLWIRPLESSRSVPIGGTENAQQPFWSPDGRFIGFFAQGKLKTVSADPANVGPVQVLADAPEPRGGTWNSAGIIVFAKNIEDGLYCA
jgi:serine/threonine protein kinase